MSALSIAAALWLARASLVASLFIVAALALARFMRQPARRQRLCEAALAAALVAVGLGLTPAWLVIDLPLNVQEDTARSTELELPKLGQLWLVERLAPSEGGGDAVPAAMVNQPVPVLASDVDRSSPTGSLPSLGTIVITCLLAFYAVGVLYYLVRWLGGTLYLRRLLRHTEPVPVHLLEALGASAARGRARVLMSRRVRGPISCGIWRPTVVLPAEFCQPSAASKLPWVFAHELTHLERRDALSALLFAVGQVVFFHLPWFWQLKKQVRLCQEFVADATAAGSRPADEYAEFLLSLIEAKALPLGATGVGGPASELLRRITMLLENPLRVEKRCPRLWSWGLGAALLALAGLLGGIGLRAEAADTIIIIIPGQKTNAPEPKDTKANQPKKADDKRAGASDKTNKDDVTVYGLNMNDYRIPVLANDSEYRIPVLANDSEYRILVPLDFGADTKLYLDMETLDPEHNKAAPADELERLKKVVKELEEIQRIRPDAKDLREVTRRLRDRIKTLEAQPRPKAEAPKDSAPMDSPEKASTKGDSTWLRAHDSYARSVVADPNVAWQLFRQEPQLKGRFGIRFSPPSGDLREHLVLPKDQGMVIEEVFKDTPAAKAGLKAKDIVLKLNNQAVPSNADKALKIFENVKDGVAVDLTILRRGKEVVIKGVAPQPGWNVQLHNYVLASGQPYHVVDVARSDDVPEKGALVSILMDGAAFTAKHREKNLSITVKGRVKNGTPTDLSITVQADGKEVYQDADPAAVPEPWRQRVSRLLDLSRTQVQATEGRR
jgi:beta-lactamase regulating signal transducer with metallopeptidase domain